ncbi:hypothetical protein MPSEU_001004100 [Mayamaea pseudoterrestris]|nr:hypothetical protein MPSEU_001004100 [Mayamaea pseudoterrestris]
MEKTFREAAATMSDETLESDVGIESDGHQQSIPAAPVEEQAAGEQDTCNNGAAAPNNSLTATQQTKASNSSKSTEHYDAKDPAKANTPYEETKCDAGDLSVGTDSGDWSDSSGGNASNPDGRYNHYRPPISDNRPILSQADIEICMEIDQHFDHALQEQDISYTARFNSVRQSACFSVIFMLIYLTLGTVFFVQQADWTIADSLLFSVYTITTVGYGHLEHPQTPAFQMYTIMFIFIGIACLTIMVAQVYQCMALEATRAQHAQDIRDMSRQQATFLSRSQVAHPAAAPTTSSNGSVVDEIVMNRDSWSDHLLRWMFRARVFFRDNEYGRSISVLFPFLGLILAGSLVVGPIEGWTVVESLYFAVVSLTTTGYGDYYPTRTASIWYCVLWLPFSIGFMSLFLGNVAAFYIRLSDANIERIESQLRRRLQRIKERQEKERREARRRALRGQERADTSEEETDLAVEIGTVEIENGQRQRRRMRSRRHHFDKLPTTEHPADDSADTASQGSRSSGSRGRRFLKSNRSMFPNRRDAILHNSRRPTNESISDQASAETLLPLPAATTSMSTMRDVLMAVHRNIDKESSEGISLRSANDPEFEFLSIRSRTTVHRSLDDRSSVLRPSFALRALVQERLSEIIAAEIAGYTSNVDIHDNSMTITIDVLRETADKWMLPRRARKSFRSICFEALVFVGEHGLITRGADALYDLTPFEYHSLFAPLLAAMGDAETMAGWLASTQVLSDVDLHRRTTLSVSNSTKNDVHYSNVVDRVDSNEELQHELRLTID